MTLFYMNITIYNYLVQVFRHDFLCRYVEVADLKNRKRHYFLARRWLSVQKGDGKLQCDLPVANETNDLKRFSYLFPEKAQMSLKEDHLWWSLYLRPPTSSFTRCQRLAVVFTALMSGMTVSAMYYESIPTNVDQENRSDKEIGFQQVTSTTF